MQLNLSFLEWVGYLGSALVAVSLTMSSILKLRWLNLVGAAVFTFYGFAIGASPVGLLNLFIVLADIYYLIKIYLHGNSFKAVLAITHDPAVAYFLDYNQGEISRLFPDFELRIFEFSQEKERPLVFLLFSNSVIAGIFLAH